MYRQYIWQFSCLLLIYSIPIISFVFYPLRKYFVYGKISSFFGKIEWFLSVFRDLFLTAFLISVLIYQLVLFALNKIDVFPSYELSYIFFIALSILAFLNRRARLKLFLKFISESKVLEPEEFFNLYFSTISGLPGILPQKITKELSLPIDYRRGKTGISAVPIIVGSVMTALMTRLIMRSSKWFGDDFFMSAVDNLTTVWAAGVLKITASSMEIEGIENLNNIKGRSIFVATHKSFLDFVIVPLTIGIVNMERSEKFRGRYMAARDHFLDNPFLYRIIGMGRVMEKVGTIFVDRKAKKKRAIDAVSDAAEAMTNKHVDIVIFPQGTRASGSFDVHGNRVDAGYFTTGKPDKLIKDRGHVKKGAAYLAVDVAKALKEKGESLNIIPLSIKGVGIIGPNGEVKLQKGVALKTIIGKPFSVSDHSVEDLHREIDESFKEGLQIIPDLKKRLVVDIRRMLGETEINKLFEAIDAWRSDQDLIFSVVDCIYSLPAKKWSSFFGQLYHLLVETDTPREEIVDFKKVIIGEMIKGK